MLKNKRKLHSYLPRKEIGTHTPNLLSLEKLPLTTSKVMRIQHSRNGLFKTMAALDAEGYILAKQEIALGILLMVFPLMLAPR